MAKRKRSETLSLRVSTEVKRQIEALAAFHGTSATGLLEGLVKDEAIKAVLIPEEEVRDLFEAGQRISIDRALQVSDHEYPEIARLRLYFIAPDALSEKDLRISSTIVDNLEIFGGETPIFEEFVVDEILRAKLGRRAAVSLEKIRQMEAVLEEWHSFHVRNKGWKSDFRFFLEMTGHPIQ
ncbi:hypothetical protein [Pseudomonas oryzihabitans]|uniref:hypothetical protein n=1 Tax=Pseudomonas oryzihabitans TaxID=47885 RepID=UPI00241BFDEC|nr:hypothetical protein [Pseudomonas oryzihabitans]